MCKVNWATNSTAIRNSGSILKSIGYLIDIEERRKNETNK